MAKATNKLNLAESASRNRGVVAKRVKRYNRVVKILKDRGVQTSEYVIQHPLSSRKSLGQETRASLVKPQTSAKSR